MNRSPINATPLGSGSKNTLIKVAVTAVMELACELRASVVKYGAFSTDFALQATVRATRLYANTLDFVGALAGQVAGRVWRPVPAAFTTFCHLAPFVAGTREVSASLDLAGQLTPEMAPTVKHASFAVFTTAFELSGQVSGDDLNYEPAPASRRVAVGNEQRYVAVPGSASDVGV